VSGQTRSQIKGLLERHGLQPRSELGQHFLADPNLIRKLVSLASIGPGDRVVEIGAGTGSLTRALAEAGAHVISYEVDPRLEPVLNEMLSGLSVDLHMVDATEVDLAAALAGSGWKLVSNLPYNVGTPLLLDMLRKVHNVAEFTVMVQLEVALRLTATEGTEFYGLPSVVVGIHADADLAFKIPPQVFLPAPNVSSAVVRMIRNPALAEEAIVLAGAAFGQRRKMLRSSLRAMLGEPVPLLIRAGIDPTVRAEDLSPLQYLQLAEVVNG
jgi:16S rRNA (adenine1518-N6/adenine1519-N6)-dimethyltransferase